MANAIVTGGSGFVGTHLINHLLSLDLYEQIINVDIVEPKEGRFNEDNVNYIHADVRKRIDPEPFIALGCDKSTVLFNLAAICRIPGFPEKDYFETNISGAENCIELAENLEIQKIIFTSSIAPYGASEELKTECSIPMPDNPYGSSKLVAEYIHRGWFRKAPDQRSLTILRPGIIFGKGENANFTRLYTSLKRGFFVYPGRKDTRKACIYVKDVARACSYFAQKEKGSEIYNLVYEQAPTIETICKSIHQNTDAGRAKFRVPGALLVAAAVIIRLIGKIIQKDFTGIHPDRVKKVMISTNLEGVKLKQSGFTISYSLDEAIQDWYEECEKTIC